MNSKIPECDCTKKCRSRDHGSLLTAAITKRSVSDENLASFLISSCYNFLRGLDKEGRTVLHMVASRGRRSLLEWMIKGSSSGNAQGTPLIDIKDMESGYTALHRSIYYGQINTAVELMKKGANVTITDYEDYTALDLAVLDRPLRFELSTSTPCEVYVWGTNNNYTLGTGSQHQRLVPELLTTFNKKNISIKQASISKFHSVFVGSCGSVWSCGHGEGGRLGTMAGGTCVLPTFVNLKEPCLQAAVARDHTIFLMASGLVMTCGLNTHYQLGITPPPPSVLAPRATRLKLPQALGVCAGRYHSVAFGPRGLFTWGLNGGQLGHSKEDGPIVAPKKVYRFGDEIGGMMITSCATSDGATVVSTVHGDVFLLHQFQCKKIATVQHDIKCLRVVGGEAIGGDKMTDHQKKISVLMLNKFGILFLWQDTTNVVMRCIFAINHTIDITFATLTRENIMIVTKYGEVFQGTVVSKKNNPNKAITPLKDGGKKGSPFDKFYTDENVSVKLKKIPNIHRAVEVIGDRNGNNFAVLQVKPNSCLIDLPQVTTLQLASDMLELFHGANEYDAVHDAIVKFGSQTYPAHKFILCSGSDHFAKLCSLQNNGEINNKLGQFENDKKLVINLEHVHPEIGRRMLEYLYTGTCDLLKPGPCKLEIRKESTSSKDTENPDDAKDPVIDEEKSAFEVYKNTNKDKNKKSSKKKGKVDVIVETDLQDPVRLLQEAAKKYQIVTLYKLLSKYRYEHGCVYFKVDKKFHVPRPSFDRKSFPDLWDTIIKCEDNHIIKAHKCILVSRLEYFNGMFAHSWTESSANSTITLPIPSSLLEPIIDFLYTDECPTLEKIEDVEYLCNMLVIADQLFITRIREMCEETFSKLISLKNISEIFQLASTYNCTQLKTCCMEYISLNLPTLLESKALESIPAELLQDLTSYYSSYNPKMCSRVITPFNNAASDEEISMCASLYPINLNDEYKEEMVDDVKKDLTLSGGKKIKNRPRNISFTESDKARRRNESVSSVASLDTSLEDKTKDVTLSLNRVTNDLQNEKTKTDWVKVDSLKKKQNKILEARLKVVTAAKENSNILNCQPESFTTLVKQDQTHDRSVAASSPPRHSPNSPQNSFDSPQNSPSPTSPWACDINEFSPRTTQTTLSIVMEKKLSQKQRKKLALEGKDLAEHLDKLNIKAPWNNAANNCTQPEVVLAQPVKPNPWQKIEVAPIATTVKKKEPKMDFMQILEDERKQRENLNKMMAKPLALTQLEDKAIDDLLRYYSATCGDEERISVQRVQTYQIAAPQWINKSSSSFK